MAMSCRGWRGNVTWLKIGIFLVICGIGYRYVVHVNLHCFSQSSPAFGRKPQMIATNTVDIELQKIANDPVISYLMVKNLYLNHTKMASMTSCNLDVHLITSFPMLYTPTTLKNGGLDNVKFRRQLEYLETLYNNVQHPCVAGIHIFADKDLPIYLNQQRVVNFSPLKHKLKFKELSRSPNMSELWTYAWTNLPQRIVAIANADIFIGGGLEKIDGDRMKTKHIAFSITRQPHPAVWLNDSSLCVEDSQNFCDTYKGSHDFHMMYMDKPFPRGVIRALEFQMNSLGAENVLIHMWQKKLNLTVLNPCKTVTIVHNHCSGHRTYSDKRVDRIHGWLIGRVKGSDKLDTK
ncbi:unnamed protein product [Owenia fusiformis]|uniref:Uncharacterized protein n=1 Tax=Owenia fusiformis TaxID=6347 RepID=A0A8S4PGG1_OWEFU|nr:unnamed protein product [Owenia fusiformis]